MSTDTNISHNPSYWIERLRSYQKLEENWDGEGARKPDEETINLAINTVTTLLMISNVKIINMSLGGDGHVYVTIRQTTGFENLIAIDGIRVLEIDKYAQSVPAKKKAFDILTKMNGGKITPELWSKSSSYAKTNLKKKALIVTGNMIRVLKDMEENPDIKLDEHSVSYWEQVSKAILHFNFVETSELL